MARSNDLALSLQFRVVSFLLAIVVGCGPPLTDPSSVNVSGRWSSVDKIGPVSDITLQVAQQENGVVSGAWTGKFFPPDAPCPPGLTPAASGPVTGTNTVLELRFAISGVGDFEGQAIDADTLRGSVQSCNNVYAVTFTFLGP